MEASGQLSDAANVALAWQPDEGRDRLATLLALDARLSRVVVQAREPMLAQVRLAWWREELAKGAEHARGEPLLANISRAWAGEKSALIGLVDGWEQLLGPPQPDGERIASFANARRRAFAALSQSGEVSDTAAVAGCRWAFADLPVQLPHEDEREVARKLGRDLPPPKRLPRSLRGVAVLDALAHRALKRGEPMMAGRGAALLAWRVGMTGR